MGTIYHTAAQLPWRPHPAEGGLVSKELASLPEMGLTVRLNCLPWEGAAGRAHPRCHLPWVLAGRDRLWVEDVGDLELAPGIFVFVTPGLRHRVFDGDEPVEVLTTSLTPSAGPAAG